MVSPKVHVKALGKTNAVMCEFAGCENSAQYLFGTGVGSIIAEMCSLRSRRSADENTGFLETGQQRSPDGGPMEGNDT